MILGLFVGFLCAGVGYHFFDNHTHLGGTSYSDAYVITNIMTIMWMVTGCIGFIFPVTILLISMILVGITSRNKDIKINIGFKLPFTEMKNLRATGGK